MDIHVIPVPRGYTPEAAWMEISVMGQLVGYRRWKPRFWRMTWVGIIVDDPDESDHRLF